MPRIKCHSDRRQTVGWVHKRLGYEAVYYESTSIYLHDIANGKRNRESNEKTGNRIQGSDWERDSQMIVRQVRNSQSKDGWKTWADREIALRWLCLIYFYHSFLSFLYFFISFFWLLSCLFCGIDDHSSLRSNVSNVGIRTQRRLMRVTLICSASCLYFNVKALRNRHL